MVRAGASSVADTCHVSSSIADLTAALAERISGPVYVPGDAGYAAEIAAHNTATVHTPDVVVGVTSGADVVGAIRVAREHGYQVSVQGTGHGADAPIDAGILISTRRLDRLDIDAEARVATIGAGVRWGAVVAAAAEHGLAPITGSSPTVGCVGYLLGGGLGPLARSHGFSSDYLVGLTVVTGQGDLIDVDRDQSPGPAVGVPGRQDRPRDRRRGACPARRAADAVRRLAAVRGGAHRGRAAHLARLDGRRPPARDHERRHRPVPAVRRRPAAAPGTAPAEPPIRVPGGHRGW